MEIKWKAEVVFTRSIVNELPSWHIQGDEIEGESGVTQITIDELHSSDILREQTERESGVSPSIIDEHHSWANQSDQMDGKVVLLVVSLMNFILRISNEIK